MTKLKNTKFDPKKIFGRVKNIGVKKGIGFKPTDDFYIDEDLYIFGFKVKSNRYWSIEDYKSKKTKTDRNIVKGFTVVG